MLAGARAVMGDACRQQPGESGESGVFRSGCKARETSVFPNTDTDKIGRQVYSEASRCRSFLTMAIST